MVRTFISVSAVIFFVIISTACSFQKNNPRADMNGDGIAIPPLEFAVSSAVLLWEGGIEQREIKHYRIHRNGETGYVLVLIRNELPAFYKHIEYLDREGDGKLDLVKMKIYEDGKGWRSVGITEEHRYALDYAEGEYKELLEKVRALREDE